MRIPLKVCFFAGGLRAMAHFLVISEIPHIFTPIEAIVDTGSPTTILGIPDLKRARVSQIQLNRLESKKEPMSYGGGKVQVKTLKNAKLKFGEHYDCEMPISIPVEGNKDCSQPTILGVDFMILNNFKLFFDPNKGEAYLESSEENVTEVKK